MPTSRLHACPEWSTACRSNGFYTGLLCNAVPRLHSHVKSKQECLKVACVESVDRPLTIGRPGDDTDLLTPASLLGA